MALPVIAVFGATDLRLRSPGPEIPDETRDLDCRCYPSDDNLERVLVEDRPDVLVSFGTEAAYPRLMRAPFQVRKRWLNFAAPDDLDAIGGQVYQTYLNNALGQRTDTPPVVSVFTPTYRTGHRIQRPLQSMLRQSYPEWEWVILDDSNDDGATFRELSELAKTDHRISVYRMHRASGRIGEVKRQACGLCRGDILLELDHDDELTHDALANVVNAFREFPDAGFAYTQWAEVFEDGRNAIYPPGWAFGYGADHAAVYGGRELVVHEAPKINPKTIRHIVSAPNHIRAWRRDFYWSIGGHRPEVHVADDFDICVRTFLHTRMILVPKLSYIQYYNESGNTQRVRNKDIQRLTRNIQFWYDKAIHERFRALGVDDFVFDERKGFTVWSTPNPREEQHCSLIATG
jgi:glycosyltransferase involved in cell wall biosynthesis